MRLGIYYILSLISLTAYAQSERAPKGGDMAGNGGGVVVCGEPSGIENDKVEAGVYSNDYMQTRDAQDFIEPGSLEESFAHVDRMLANVPDMRANFAVFRSLINNDRPEVGNRIWKPSAAELEEINDHDSVRKLPANCLPSKENPSHGLYQLIVRKVTGLSIYYEVQKSLLEKLKKLPLQLSMLFSHEWLWDYVKPDQAYMTRQLNAALHDPSSTPEQIAVMVQDFQMALAVSAPARRKDQVSVVAAAPAPQPVPQQPISTAEMSYAPQPVPVIYDADIEDRMRVSLKTFIESRKRYYAAFERLLDDALPTLRTGRIYLLASGDKNDLQAMTVAVITLLDQADSVERTWWTEFEKSEKGNGKALPSDVESIREKIEEEVLGDFRKRVKECKDLLEKQYQRLKGEE